MQKAQDNSGKVSALADVARLVREDFRRRAQHVGLTQPQWRALFFLSKSPGLNQAALARLLEVHPVTVTQLVERLVNAGWLVRETSAEDRRVVKLRLTEDAEPLLEELNRVGELTREATLAGFSNIERRQLDAMLARIKHNLCEGSLQSNADSATAQPTKDND